MKIKSFTSHDEAPEGRQFQVKFGKPREEGRNAFSILIGPNGTRKSRTLRDILDLAYPLVGNARRNSGRAKIGKLELWSKEMREHAFPSKIIAVSGVATDRFPSRLSAKNDESGDGYRYIGPRTESNLVSRVQSINQIALSLLTLRERVRERHAQLKHAFSILRVSNGILFEFDRSEQAGDGRWTAPSLDEYIASHRGQRNVAVRLRKDEALLEDSANLINSQAPIELRLDLDDEIRIDATDEKFESIWLLLSAGLLAVKTSYVWGHNEQQLHLTEFSSGQWHILSSLLFVALNVENDTLILIDEPENSLHPSWQQEYLRMLRAIMVRFHGVHVIVATHSPLVAASLGPDESEVIRIRDRGGRLTSSVLKCGPFGWTSDEILQEVFGLPSSRSIAFTKQMDQALALLAKGDRNDRRLQNLVNSLRKIGESLPEDDVARSVIETLVTVTSTPSTGEN